jgi:putative endopeptidase
VLTPHVAWDDQFSRMGHPEIDSFNMSAPEFFKAVDRELEHTPLEDWKRYLRWHPTETYAPYLSRPPYFDVNWPDATNYGATGATTVGHEMTHGFDDEGARFDGHGNLKDWWAPADLEKFNHATRCISAQYSRLTVEGGLHVQGDLVTGEAAADLGGLMLALRAFHSLPAPPQSANRSTADTAFTPDQQFFIAFAHSWAGAVRAEQARELVTADPHPPAEFRTNATLANSAQFQAAFTMTPRSPMVKAPRCVIW